ncbi:beta-ribofuranosylaminobenzene 5'-phosphate synthase [Methanobrevibacter curvatus]|uniref:Beta-ribofuranosylaminobenzene 5'-phosphate synthase n=1 Tax=Methanobrevibacter curvatus TaxID=49547 RepID=A0A166E5C1_9EURY|nr:beta-ribofuranosylaminobenzene 5'-phosphate synthase [Methanobrevibacter curvatus]KZX16296.1 shikimate kinase [Methanobrevibacter curvatus]
MIIKTPSRIHMALIDLNGSYARCDGGIGLTINKPSFTLKCDTSEKKEITIDFSEDLGNNGLNTELNTESNNEFNNELNKEVKSQCIAKINESAERIISHFQLETGFHFDVKETLFPHTGLGSGTQISLATAKLICEYNDIAITGLELGKILKRGGTSGIGIYSFEKGGFIIDGGHSMAEKNEFLPSSASKAKPPVLIGRYDFPEDWEVIIAITNQNKSNNVMGKKEVNIFQEYCPVPKKDVEQLSHLIFMNLMPFLLEKNIESFGDTINKIQNLGFKKVEIDLQQKKVKGLMNKMREFGAYGVGMSSFGPAIYGIIDKNNADVLKATKEFIGNDGIVFKTEAQNHGFELKK